MSTGTGAEDAALGIVLEAGAAKSREEWLFVLANRSVAAAAYDRASAWSAPAGAGGALDAGAAELLAVSGAAVPDAAGAFAEEWKTALKAVREPAHSALLHPPPAAPGASAASGTLSLPALWIPVPERETGFLFERWEGEPFSAAERTRLEKLLRASALAFAGGGRRAPSRARRRAVAAGVLVAALAVLTLVRLPLRVAAECEVAARNPRLVAAPMDGVVAEVLVRPGQRVEAGEALAVYDSRMMEEELNVLRRQAGVAEAELATARARGFTEQNFRAETSRLEARLEQERARLRALETRYARRVVSAPVAGMVQLDDPRAWRGRPVATGEAVLWLVEPGDTRLAIWLPQDDRVDFDAARPVGVHLYALGGGARAARLTYVSAYARPVGDGRYVFPAEAEWADGGDAPPLGLRGTAFLYGDEVSLGYWLVRRPLGWLRRWTGI